MILETLFRNNCMEWRNSWKKDYWRQLIYMKLMSVGLVGFSHKDFFVRIINLIQQKRIFIIAQLARITQILARSGFHMHLNFELWSFKTTKLLVCVSFGNFVHKHEASFACLALARRRRRAWQHYQIAGTFWNYNYDSNNIIVGIISSKAFFKVTVQRLYDNGSFLGLKI